MSDRDRLYEHVLDELDLDYVDRVGAHVRRILNVGGIAEIDYVPGDGTRYPMTFVPLRVQQRVDGLPAWPGVDYETGVLVALGGGNKTAYAINLLGRRDEDYIAHTYVGEHWFGGREGASPMAVALLFEAVAGVVRYDPRPQADAAEAL